jgi:hypothetical protein
MYDLLSTLSPQYIKVIDALYLFASNTGNIISQGRSLLSWPIYNPRRANAGAYVPSALDYFQFDVILAEYLLMNEFLQLLRVYIAWALTSNFGG